MQTIRFNCPNCQQHIEADGSIAGTQVACPACQASLTVPEPQKVSIWVAPREQSASETSALAIWSLVLGILSLLCALPIAIPAVICGHMALSKIRRLGAALSGKGLAVAGLVTGYVGMVLPTVLVFFFLMMPNFVRSRTTSQEYACINNLRLIESAKQLWALEHDKGPNDVPVGSDLQPYLGRGTAGELPYCPSDSTMSFTTSYSPNKVGEKPTCKISPSAHMLP